jgi:CheY-like chemotaxis protein
LQSGLILAVEDYEDLRNLIGEVLTEAGYEVVLADSGARALVLAKERKGSIRVLITDVRMPRMSGFELASELAAGDPDLRVVLMSGDPIPEADLDRPAGGRRPVALLKPFTVEELLDAVRVATEGLSRP